MQIIFNIIAVIIISILIVKLFLKSMPDSFNEQWKHKLLFILITALVVKMMIVGIWYLNVGHSFYIHEGSLKDSGSYEKSGQYLASYFRQGILFKSEFLRMHGEYLGFPYYVGLIYTLFGNHQIMVSVFNTLASIILSLLMFHIALALFNNKKIAFWTLIFNLFYGHYVSQSYYLLKDIFLLFLVVLFYWLAIKIEKNKQSFINYLWMVIVTIWIYFLRAPLSLILGGLYSIFLIFRLGFKEKKILKTAFFLLVCVSVTIGLGVFSPRGRTSFEKIKDCKIGQEGYRGSLTPSYIEGARGPKEILSKLVGSPIIAAKDFFRSMIIIYWGPTYFYQRSGASIFYAYDKFVFWQNMGSLLRVFLMPMVIFGFFYCLKRKRQEAFLFYSFVAIWTIIMFLVGSGERWSMNLMPFIFMFAAIGIVNFNKIKPFYILYILILNILIATNITLDDNLIVAKPLIIFTFMSVILGWYIYRKNVFVRVGVK